ncbi:hypothetical protein [Methanospirillum hungatei]|uniref:hypothetical protein n=1 Tax=Methanospirillum hungatei TaxID=2203 RepID=UPI0026ECB750|nr:hypothetical protein [Methanospirillum hungatei]MCA1915888.1 hypothetical protein [Methanospirillum hungatei]
MSASRYCNKTGLRSLAGTLSHDEAEKMQKFIDEEFGKIEGEWQGSSGYQWDFE